MEDHRLTILNTCFRRIAEATESNDRHFLERLVRNCNMAIAALEADNVINEAQKGTKTLKAMNKKINMSTHLRSIDNVLVYIFFLLKEMLDVKIKPDDDLAVIYDIPVFAEIVDFEEAVNDGRSPCHICYYGHTY